MHEDAKRAPVTTNTQLESDLSVNYQRRSLRLLSHQIVFFLRNGGAVVDSDAANNLNEGRHQSKEVDEQKPRKNR